VFMVVVEPSRSLAGELKRALPKLRQSVGEERRVTVCFDRDGWPAAVFADILDAKFDLITYREGPTPDLPAAAFTTVACARVHPRRHHSHPGGHRVPRKGEHASLRQVGR
jgi:hypothetical protein